MRLNTASVSGAHAEMLRTLGIPRRPGRVQRPAELMSVADFAAITESLGAPCRTSRRRTASTSSTTQWAQHGCS